MFSESNQLAFVYSFSLIQDEVYLNSVNHGFWESKNDGEKLALIHSEISEALEAVRSGNKNSEKIIASAVEEELADAVIRIMDYCGYHGFNLAQAVLDKHEYNKNRPHKHGKKF